MKYFLPCPFLSRTQSVSASSYRSVFNENDLKRHRRNKDTPENDILPRPESALSTSSGTIPFDQVGLKWSIIEHQQESNLKIVSKVKVMSKVKVKVKCKQQAPEQCKNGTA